MIHLISGKTSLTTCVFLDQECDYSYVFENQLIILNLSSHQRKNKTDGNFIEMALNL